MTRATGSGIDLSPASTVLLSPHNDDAVLFSTWNLLRHRPHVVTVFLSVKQKAYGITAAKRQDEDLAAFRILGVRSWKQLPHLDSQPLPPTWLDELAGEYEFCIAPAVEGGGHEQHNEVGRAALDAFGAERTIRYLTYRRHHGKSDWGREVPYEPAWVALKLQALACYRTQIETVAAGCTPHFAADLREYVAT